MPTPFNPLTVLPTVPAAAGALTARAVPAAPATLPNPRVGLPLTTTADTLGPLADLAGLWVGTGFNLISLPDFSGTPPQDFRLKLNATIESLQFTPIGGNIPNRGSVSAPGATTGQPDINLFGLTYMQRVSDLVTNSAMHVEPGIWVNVPATTVAPVAPASLVRMGTIPHGDSVLAQSTFIKTDAVTPVIAPVSSTPFTAAGPVTNPAYLAAFANPPLPPTIKLPYVANPNLFLLDSILGQNILGTIVFVISTNVTPAIGGIFNIPFLTANANPTQLDATFWIETVQNPDGTTFLQLQYTQTVILSFLGISWPHISVATLTKQ